MDWYRDIAGFALVAVVSVVAAVASCKSVERGEIDMTVGTAAAGRKSETPAGEEEPCLYPEVMVPCQCCMSEG